MSGTFIVNYLLMLAMLGQVNAVQDGGWRAEAFPADSTSTTLHLPWLIDNTLELRTNSDTLEAGVDFQWNDSTRTLTIQSCQMSVGDSIFVRYREAKVTSQTLFQQFTPTNTTETDSTQEVVFSSAEPKLNPFSNWRDLRKSGSLTRGVKFGESADGTSSRMHLELSGDPAPNVRVDAVLDDQNLSAGSEASSATLSELERVLFRISTPSLYAEFGDWDIDWEDGKYSQVSKQLKGGRLAVDLGEVETEVAAGVSDLSYTSQTLVAREGYLGPYELTDKYSNPGVSLASGSEKIFLNGRRLSQGRNADYIIDYASGLLTFTPRISLTDNSRIEVEYEYLEGVYPRYFYGGRVNSSFGDVPKVSGKFYTPSTGQRDLTPEKGWRFNAVATIEAQDENNPRSISWRDDWLQALEDAGDDRAKATVNGADSVGVGKGDYIWSVIGADTVLAFSTPDSAGLPTGYLSARFARSDNGGYDQIYDTELKAVYYQWVGAGNGTWSPNFNIPLPEKSDHFDFGAAFVGDGWEVATEAAFTDRDINTLSALDDGDNTGVALNGSAKYGDLDKNRFTIEVAGESRDENYQSAQKNRSLDYQYDWNIFTDDIGNEQAVTLAVETAPLSGVTIGATGGQLDGSKGIYAQKAGVNAEVAVKIVRLDFQADEVTSDDSKADIQRSRTSWSGGLALDMNHLKPFYRFGSELNDRNAFLYASGKRLDTDHQIGLGYNWRDRQGFELEYDNRNQQRGETSPLQQYSNSQTVKFQWQSTGYRQSAWNIALQRNWLNYNDIQIPDENSTAAVVDGRYTDRKHGWLFQGQYNLNTGDDRARVTIAEYQGAGEGSYRREGDRYVPDPDGDFDLKEVGIDSVARATNVDFSGQVRWRKPKSDKREKIAGLTSSLTRVELTSTTQRNDPLPAFFLLPQSFKGDGVVYSRVSFTQRFGFHEGGSAGDERLNTRYDQTRDFSYSDGEYRRTLAVDYRMMRPLVESLRIILEPQWEQSIRKSVKTGVQKANVNTIGGLSTLEFRQVGADWELNVAYGYIQRREQTLDNQSIERSVSPGFTYQIPRGGSARLEVEWINFATWKPNAGYDLLQGWDEGDNYQATLVSDFRLDKNFTFSAYYKGRWRGRKSPVHEGLAELTVTL